MTKRKTWILVRQDCSPLEICKSKAGDPITKVSATVPKLPPGTTRHSHVYLTAAYDTVGNVKEPTYQLRPHMAMIERVIPHNWKD